MLNLGVEPPKLGAYGLIVDPLGSPNGLLVAPRTWQPWAFEFEMINESILEREEWSKASAVIRILPSGFATINRSAARTTIASSMVTRPEALLHPYLGGTAVVVANWNGYLAFHASSFVYEGGVWGILGGKEHGKSSAVGWLLASGIPVFSDDVLVVADGVARAGPRCIDLRESAAKHFGFGRDIGVIGNRRRWRVDLAHDVAPELPMRGWVTLEWSNDLCIRTCDAQERLAALHEHRAFRLRDDERPGSWLGAIALPMVSLARPREWSKVDLAMGLLLSSLSGPH